MPIYYGSSADGSDAKEFQGFHVSSCGNFWGNEPFTEQSEREMRKLSKKSEWKQRIKNLARL